MEDLQKSLRDQYSDDNDAYKAALAANNITPGNSTGKVRGIQQAYYDGTIDKGTRDYMMADTIAKFARNTGRDIGNIGAQFTGGTVNNNFETSDWDKRNEELFKQQTSAEAAGIANSDKEREATSQNLANEKSNKALEASRVMETFKNKASKKAAELRANGNPDGAAIMDAVAGEYALLTSASTSSIDKEEHIANLLASLGAAVGSGVMSKEDMSGYVKPLLAGIGGGMGTGIDVNINNPLTGGNKTGNESLDAETENDKSSNVVNTGVSDDIRNKVTEYDGSDPTGKGKIVRDLYQQAGGAADKFKLATLVELDRIDPNEDYNGVKGSDVIDKVMKNFKNEKFVKDYKHYTNMDGSSGNTIPQRLQQIEDQKREKARKIAAEDAVSFKMDLDNLSEENIKTLKDWARQNKFFGNADDKARRILDYLGIQY